MKNIFIIITAMSMAVLNMAHPVTPRLITEMKLPASMFGIFFATMAIGNFLFSPFWGKRSDIEGRIKYMVIGLIGYGVSQLGFGYGSNPVSILFFRLLGGIFVVSYLTVSLAYITDLCSEKERLKYMGYYAAATTIGGAVGSLLGGIIGNTNYKVTFLIQFVVSIILAIGVIVFLKETIIKGEKIPRITLSDFKVIPKGIKVNSELSIILLGIIIFYFSSTSYNSTINYYIESILKLPPSFIGGFMAVVGIVGFLANIIVTSLIAKKKNQLHYYKILTLLLAVFILIVSLVSNMTMFFMFILLFVSVCSIYIPVQQNMVIEYSDGEYGSIMGMQNSLKAIGMIAGSLLSGVIFDYGAKLPFFISGIVLLIGYLALLKKFSSR